MAWLFIKEKPTSLNKLWAEIHIKSLRRPVFSQLWYLFFSFPCMARIFGGPAPNDSFQVHVCPSEPGRAAAPPVSHTWDDAGLWFGGWCGGYSDPSLSSRTASVGLLGRGVDPGGCEKEEGPPTPWHSPSTALRHQYLQWERTSLCMNTAICVLVCGIWPICCKRKDSKNSEGKVN